MHQTAAQAHQTPTEHHQTRHKHGANSTEPNASTKTLKSDADKAKHPTRGTLGGLLRLNRR